MIKAGIVGISGYSGVTCLEILLRHPYTRVTYVSANNTEGAVTDIWPQLLGKTALFCKKFDLKTAIESCDLVFLAVPHTISMQVAPDLLAANKRVIDLSGDYRLKNIKDYENWYKAKHLDPKNLKKSVYGLPELYRQDIMKAQLVSNPGCYPTAALLALAPLAAIYADNITSIIIDAKSGVSGAGRKATLAFNFAEINENFKAYKVLHHQHAPEIDLYLSKFSNHPFHVHFVPHLLPINRGILETIYVQLNERIKIENLYNVYKKFYKTESFVRLVPKGQQPEIKHVVGSNMCDIGLEISPDSRLVVVTSVIDNLVKGAAGQAVQNMNIMCGFNETEGLA